jgi:hypothetical protein
LEKFGKLTNGELDEARRVGDSTKRLDPLIPRHTSVAAEQKFRGALVWRW